MCACVCVCVCVCMRACVHVCVCVLRIVSVGRILCFTNTLKVFCCVFCEHYNL